MNKQRIIKIRSIQSLIQKAVNNIEKEVNKGTTSTELGIALSQLNDAMRILSMLHQGVTSINRPPAQLQIMQDKQFKIEEKPYKGGYMGGEIITIDCGVSY